MKEFLKNFTISIFMVVMGVIGTSLASEMAQNVFQVNLWINRAWMGISVCLLFVLLLVYILKIILAFESVKDEFNDPISINFFPTVSISIILVSQGFRTFSGQFALIMVIIGTILQLIFNFLIVAKWLKNPRIEISHLNPSWFIPVVGNLLIPVFAHQLFPIYVEWFFFSIGLLFYIILLILILYRLILIKPFFEKLLPLFFILIALPSISSLAFYQLTGQRNPTVIFFYCTSFFFFVLLFFLIDLFIKNKYSIFWWGYTFPLAVFTIATFFMSAVWQFLKWVGLGTAILLNILTFFILIITLIKLIDGKLFN